MDGFRRFCSIAVLATLGVLLMSNVALCADPKEITVAIDRGNPPYAMKGIDDKPNGLLVDIWKLWGETTGVEVKFIQSSWADTLSNLKEGKVDVHMGMFKNEQRAQWIEFSNAFHEIKSAIYFLTERDLAGTLPDLNKARVGVVSRTFQEQYLKNQYPDAKVYGFLGNEEQIRALALGEIDYATGVPPTFEALLGRLGYKREVTRGVDELISNTLHVGVKKENKELLDFIRKGFADIDFAKLAELDEYWLPNPADRFYRKSTDVVDLTREEEEWLAVHPFLRFAVTDFINPVDIVNDDGTYNGLNADLMILLNKKLGTRIVPEFFSKWSDVVEAALTGAVDGVFSFSRTPEREQHVFYTRPYAYDPIVVITRQDNQEIKGWADLKGKRITVVKGFSVADEARGQIGDGELIEVDEAQKALRMLSLDEIDAHIDYLIPYGNALKDSGVTGLKIADARNTESGSFRIAIHKDQPILFSIIQKGMNALTRAELASLEIKWLAPRQSQEMTQNRLNLSPEERLWLELQDEITVGMMTDWPPISFVDENGIKSGISPAFVEAINKRLGGRLKLKPGAWKDHLDDLKNDRIDALLDLTPTEERKEIYNFTKPYLSIPHVIIARKNIEKIENEEDLKGMVLALEQGFGNVKYFRENFPEVDVKEYPDTARALDAVSRGEADAYAGNRAVATYFMEKEVILNLKPHGRLNKSGSVLAFGVRKNWPVLASILQKALDDIGQEESRDILREWVSSGKSDTIKIALYNSGQPLFWADENGRPLGVFVDIWKLWAKKTGKKIRFITSNWPKTLENLKKGEADIHAGLFKTDERAQWMDFSDSIYGLNVGLYVRSADSPQPTMETLKGRKIGIIRNSVQETFVKNKHPDVIPVLFDKAVDAIEATANGEVDAFFAAPVRMANRLESMGYSQRLRPTGEILYSGQFYAAVRKDDLDLLDTINSGLQEMTVEELAQIEERWLSDLSHRYFVPGREKLLLSLTPDERKWLENHSSVRVMAGTWPPFHFVENDEPQGMALDYVKAVLAATGLEIEFVPIGWADALKSISNLEKIDLLPTIARSPEREELVAFTKPYLSFPRVIFARKDDKSIGSLNSLHGRTVAVEKNFIAQKLLEKDHPEIKLLIVGTTREALEAVSFGKADAFVSNLAVGSYLINELGLLNLKVAARTSYKDDIQSMGVRKDWPELASILNKALAAIPDKEKREIRDRWFIDTDIPVAQKEDVESIDLILQIGGGVFIMIILLFAMIFTMRVLEGRDTSRLYQSRELKGLGIVMIGLFLCVVVLSAWYTVKSVEENARKDIGYSLQTILHSTHEALKLWMDRQKGDLLSITETFGVRTQVRNLLQVPRNRDDLLASNELFQIRNMFDGEKNRIGGEGFYIIANDGVSVASKNDGTVGLPNLIFQQRKDLFERVFDGEIVLVPPLFYDGDEGQKEAAMFLAAPVMGLSGKNVIAALAMRIDPKGEFSDINQLGRMGLSGETYTFDGQGRMMSDSRFKDDLKKTGLLGENDDTILNIRVADPGGNLIKKFPLPEDLASLPLTVMAAQAIGKKSGLNVEGYRDYRGVPVMGAWLWDEKFGLGMTTEVDVDEALNSYFTIRNTLVIVLGVTVLMALILTGLSTWIGRSANRSLRKARDDLERKVEERTAEAAQKEAQLRLAMDTMTDGIFMLDADLKFVVFNDHYRDLVDLPEDVIEIGVSVSEAIKAHANRGDYGPGDPGGIIRKRRLALLNDQVVETELSINNGKRILSLRKAPIEGGGAVVALTDITERKRQEEALRKSEQQFRRILEESPVAVAISLDDNSSDDGTVQFANPKFIDMVGISDSDIGKIKTKKFVPEGEMRDRHEQALEKGKSLFNTEQVISDLNGRELWTLMSMSPINYMDKQSALIWFYDITERKQAEEEIAFQRKNLSYVLENVAQGIVKWSANLKLDSWNRQFKDIFNTPEEYLKEGLSLEELTQFVAKRGDYGDGDPEELAKARMEYLTDGQAKRSELAFGDDSTYDVITRPTDDGGFIVTYADITERKKAEVDLTDAYNVISGSIDYAARIQRSVLPDDTLFSSLLSDHFVLWEPRDVVGGDIYWSRMWGDGFLIILGDCTGHGVPGAFMTLIATGALDNALSDIPGGQVAELMQRLHQLVQSTLGQHGEGAESDDGMELGICYLGPDLDKVTFVGARFELYLVEDGNVSTIKGTKSGIGYHGIPHNQEYEEHDIVNLENKSFYMTSDGLVDQVGGERNRMFGKKRLRELLLEIHDKPMKNQQECIYQALVEYQGGQRRRDDVAVIGFKVG